MDFLVCDGDSEAFYRVDNFSGGGGKKGRGRVHAYFLTHMHADHLQGLTDEWDAGPLYASSQTIEFVRRTFPGISKRLLHDLPLGNNVVNIGAVEASVAFIDAHHCMGSVMLHIRDAKTHNRLHTGDFRYDAEMEAHLLEKRDQDHGCESIIESLQDVDEVYIDTTFWHDGWNFPSRAAVAESLITVVKQAMREGRRVYIGSDMMGQEYLLQALAEALGKNAKLLLDTKGSYIPDPPPPGRRGKAHQTSQKTPQKKIRGMEAHVWKSRRLRCLRRGRRGWRTRN